MVGNSVSEVPIRKHVGIWDNNVKLDFICPKEDAGIWNGFIRF